MKRPPGRVRRWWRRVLHRLARLGRLPRSAVERRRTSSLWTYLCLAGSWALLTWAGARAGWALFMAACALLAPPWADLEPVLASLRMPWLWTAWGASAGLFLLLFEVGISNIIAAAWHSHGTLELDAESKAVQDALERIRRQRSSRAG